MPTVIENLNSVLRTKTELNTILRENGIDGGEVFSEYPTKFRSIISGTGVPTYQYLNTTYATKSYVVDYVNTYATPTDLSAYATKAYVVDYVSTYSPVPDLSSYVTYTYLESKEYISSIPTDYATYTAISEMGYATTSSLPIIDETLIPKENNTYTLGSGSYLYSNTYSVSLNSDSGNGLVFKLGANSKTILYDTTFRPVQNNGLSLGTSSNQWSSTYTGSLYLGAVDILSLIPKAITLTATPTSDITTTTALANIGISSDEVHAATLGLRTVINDTTKNESYPIWLSSWTDANNFKLNYGTMVLHTVGTVESIDTYYEVDITVTGGTVSVSVKS